MDLNLTSTRHLGGTITAGSTASGSRYASHTTRAPHTSCWMALAVFPGFPTVPSLAGTQVQERQDLLTSTKGAGAPQEMNLLLEMELFDDECPQLCANFRRLCSGVSATRQGTVYCHQGLTPSYRGTYFHKIIPGYCAQGGDLTMRVVPGGTNAYSSAGRGWLLDESKRRRHNEAGLVSMANNGPNSNGAQFFITTSAANERSFNGRHCCVGRVVQGLDDFLRCVAPYGDKDGRPSRYAVVVDCGEGPAPSSLSLPSSSPLAQTDHADFQEAEEQKEEAEEAAESNTAMTDAPSLDGTDVHAVGGQAGTVGEGARAASPPAAPVCDTGSAAPAAAMPGSPSDAATQQLQPPPLKSSMKRAATASNKHVTYQE